MKNIDEKEYKKFLEEREKEKELLNEILEEAKEEIENSENIETTSFEKELLGFFKELSEAKPVEEPKTIDML